MGSCLAGFPSEGVKKCGKGISSSCASLFGVQGLGLKGLEVQGLREHHSGSFWASAAAAFLVHCVGFRVADSVLRPGCGGVRL